MARGTAGRGAGRELIAGRAAARLAKHVELALGQLELSLPQYRMLALLAAGSSAGAALASRLVISPPSVTALVDGLLARGLVERHTDLADRRRVTHVLTAEGHEMLAKADKVVAARLDAIAGHLAEDDRPRALEGLRLWQAAMDAWLVDARAKQKGG